MSDASRRPAWLRKTSQMTPEVTAHKARIARLGLHTVCESARCPNLAECYRAGNATFLILGDRCTRGCGFCAVAHGQTVQPDPQEGERIAEHIKTLSIRYAVITSVTRDDLPDGGASQFIRVVRDIRTTHPEVGLEILVPDFQGMRRHIEEVAGLPVEVFAHNIETVQSLYATVRRGAEYERSLEVLRVAAARRGKGVRIKSGIMVGLGESEHELHTLFKDLEGAGVEILTIGQYLRPSWRNVPVIRYLPPDEFRALESSARASGIPTVLAGPYVRSSYLAESVFHGVDGKYI